MAGGEARADQPPPSQSASTGALSPAELLEGLRARGVSNRGRVPRVLYSWTTDAQAAAFASGAGPVLHPASVGQSGPYQGGLRSLGRRDDTVGRIAQHLAGAPRRFAWPVPYATSVPLSGRSYGRRLIRFTLSPAFVALTLDPDAPRPMLAHDGAGQPVSLDELAAHPERIGVVFHIRRVGRPTVFREMVVVHTGAVETWELGTAAIADRVQEEITLLETLRARVASTPSYVLEQPAAPLWAVEPASVAALPTLDAFRSSLAFDTPRHHPTPAVLDQMIRALRRYVPGRGVSGRGRLRDDVSRVPPPRRPPPRREWPRDIES
jgi:hypothetical protein